MTLKAKHPKEAKPAKPKILLYGEPGSGKTTWSLSFPEALLIDCEGGANLPHYTDTLEQSDALYLGLEDGAGDFETVINEVRALATEKHDRRTLVIDGFTKLFNNTVRFEQTRMEKAGEKMAFGNERKLAVNYTRKLMMWVDQCDMNIVFVAHSTPNYIDGEQFGIKPDCPKDITFDLNLILEASQRGKSYYARVVKSRYQQFEQGESFKLDFQVFTQKWKQSDAVSAVQ